MKSLNVLYSEEEIQRRVSELAEEINKSNKCEELVVVGVLKGAFIFMSDLVRQLKMSVRCDFLRVASYEHDKSTGIVRMEFDLTQPVVGKDILLVEDIVDTGRTLEYLLKHLSSKKPKSLKVCTLLYKDGKNKGIKERLDYVGFNIPDKYVVGYGLDSEGLYRSLPYIGYFGP